MIGRLSNKFSGCFGRYPVPKLIRRVSLACKCVTLLLILGLNTVSVSAGNAASFEEPQIKAAFLFHFFHFIKWPDSEPGKPGKAIVLCAFEEGPVESALKELLLASKASDDSIRYQLVSGPSEIAACNYLFTGRANSHLIDRVLEETQGKPILTVSDSAGFALHGGMIELVRRGTRVHVLINFQQVTDQGLRVSSKLLQLATIITPVGSVASQ